MLVNGQKICKTCKQLAVREPGEKRAWCRNPSCRMCPKRFRPVESNGKKGSGRSNHHFEPYVKNIYEGKGYEVYPAYKGGVGLIAILRTGKPLRKKTQLVIEFTQLVGRKTI